MLPEITQSMLTTVVSNPILDELDYLHAKFDEIQTVAQLAKFCIFKSKQTKDKSPIRYTVVPIKIDNDKKEISVGDIKVTDNHKDLLRIASQCDLVALISNGPEQLNDKFINTIVNRAMALDISQRYILEGETFYTYHDVMGYLGVAVIKHAYFWASHTYCMNAVAHNYYKQIVQHPDLLKSIHKENIYDWCMSHEYVFGKSGDALMRIFDMGSEHFDHFLSMIYCECDSFDDQFRISVTRMSAFYEESPFMINKIGDNIVIRKLHSHGHYQYLQHKELIDAYKAGKVTIDAEED